MEDLLFRLQQSYKTLREAINVNGFNNQVRQLQEECGELIAEVNHLFRVQNKSFDEIAKKEFALQTEIAHVLILCLQVALCFNFTFPTVYKREIERLDLRLKGVEDKYPLGGLNNGR